VLIGGLAPKRLRIPALVMGILAAMAMVIVGCTSVTSGSATIDRADPPVYRASVSASSEESAASSSVRESERQESITRQAVHASCDGLTSSSVDAITAVNNYVDAFNKNADDAAAKAPLAIDALNHSADLVTQNASDALGQNLRDALNGWVDAAKALAAAIGSNFDPNEFNAAVSKLNDAKTAALNQCDAAYR
jgi:hypothetical protein